MSIVNEFCFKILDEFMAKEVNVYRNKLGFHFEFDFKYMMFVRSTSEVQNKLYGPGIRVRYNLFDMHLYSLGIDDYIVIKNMYDAYKNEINSCIHEFNNTDYSILINENDSNEINKNMSKYYQIFVIENQDKIIEYFNTIYNK